MSILEKLAIANINPGAYISHNWHNEGAGSLKSYSPIDNSELGLIAACNNDDYEKVIKRSQLAFQQWRLVPAPKRGELIRQIANSLRQKKDLLGSLISREMGKSKQESDGEVQEMIDIADFAVGQSRMLYGKTMPSERAEHRLFEQWHPYGLVGVITAFNFPVAVWAWNAFIAAICGNVTIWKPSSKTPLCAIAVQKICNEILKSNNAPEIFNLIIPKSRDISQKMLDDSRIPLISFTGSTATGKKVSQSVGARLGRTILELGGNNAIILDKDANYELAIPAIVFGAIGTAGQRCTSTRRLFVAESDRENVLAKLKKAYAQITIGDPLDSNNLMGPLIDKAAVEQFEKAIANIKTNEGKIVFGGSVIDGCYVQPTIVSNIANSLDIVQQETFAPILYVITYKNIKMAIELQNTVPQGLSSAIFTNNLQNSELFLSCAGSDCGLANVNIGTSGAEIGGAFGGEKETGGGRESGSDAWKAYMRRQTNTINFGTHLPLSQGIKFKLD